MPSKAADTIAQPVAETPTAGHVAHDPTSHARNPRQNAHGEPTHRRSHRLPDRNSSGALVITRPSRPGPGHGDPVGSTMPRRECCTSHRGQAGRDKRHAPCPSAS